MNRNILSIALVAMLIMSIAVPYAISDASSADSSITVTDGFGNELTLDHPTNKIITIGVGATATTIGVGCLDKIVVCDSYSKTNSSSIFDGLKDNIAAGKTLANGNIYSSGKAALQTDIAYAAGEDGSFDKNTDVVIVCGGNSYLPNIVPFLEEQGFKKVLKWNDITDYSKIIDFAKTISMVCTGSVVGAVEQMEYVSNYVKDTFESSGLAKTDAMYITYSGGAYKVGNTGSLTNSMIEAACGNSITKDPSKSSSTYAMELSEIKTLVDSHPGTVIFLDNTIASNDTYLNAVRTAVGNDVRLVPLENIWNNYSIESMNGLWTMASAMYPTLFDGDVPEVPNKDTNLMPYILGGVGIVAAIGIAAFVFLRK